MMEIEALASDRNKQKHGEVKTGQYDSFVPPILIGSPWKYRYKYVGMVTLMGYIAFLCILTIRHPICFQKFHNVI
jgi:hypothetical protein